MLDFSVRGEICCCELWANFSSYDSSPLVTKIRNTDDRARSANSGKAETAVILSRNPFMSTVVLSGLVMCSVYRITSPKTILIKID